MLGPSSACCDIIHGDSIDVLRTLEPESISAIVSDPPYGMSDHDADDVVACLRAWLAGEEYRPKQRGGFMGRSWDAWVPGPELWREAFRVLKPGGYVLAFASTRTADLMGMALRLAGFRAIDTVHYLHGQGFPKSMDISKAIDRAAGAEREVVGSRVVTREFKKRDFVGAPSHATSIAITAPATDDARKWEGWGTQIKPAVEPVLVFQKPIAERTIAANVLAHGTGGVNIDACRVALPAGDPIEGGVPRREHDMDPTGAWGFKAVPCAAGVGRFPANLVLSHAPGCREVGTREIEGDARDTGDRLGGSRPSGFANVGSESGDSAPSGRVYGAETVTEWRCEPGCAIAALDAQSGTRRSGTRKSGTFRGIGYQGSDAHEYPEVEGSEGAASRFFYNAEWSPAERFMYCPKASTAERSRGLPEGERNRHATVKPVALMRWLVRLVTPPGGVVLDPFMGSGTTGVATMLEGFGFIGVERDEDSHKTASARIAAWREYETKPKRAKTPRATKAPAPEFAPKPEANGCKPRRTDRTTEQLGLFDLARV